MILALLLVAANPIEMIRPVVDDAGVLPEETDAALSQKIHAHLDESGVAVGVLILPTLGGDKIAVVADQAAAAFAAGFGADHADVIVVISTGDHIMRIAGDPALQRIIGDDEIARLTNLASQSFRDGKYPDGVNALVDGVIAKTPRAPMSRSTIVELTIGIAAGIIAVTLLVAAVLRFRARRRAST